jgi:predicted metalloprotease
MNTLFTPGGRLVRAAAILGIALAASAAPAAAALSAPSVVVAGVERTDDPVTRRDIDASNAKVAAAYSALMAMWTTTFDKLGARFEAPSLLRYRGNVRTGCGVMPTDNAVYCPQANAVYFDEVFIASVAKRVGRELGTDGDMASVGIIAHEVGHAVAIQLGYESRFTYTNEATADCLAGAFARTAKADGSLETGDLEEAYLGMAMAGDAEPELTGDPRMDARIQQRAALMGHGTREQRMQNFRSGLDRGPSGCLPAFET